MQWKLKEGAELWMILLDKVKGYTRVEDSRKAGFYPYFQPLDKDVEMIMLGSNNYLGLTHHEKLITNCVNEIVKNGTSCTGSRFLNGTLSEHLALEASLADFYGRDDAQTFTTGYQANLGVISAMAGRGDYVIIDKEAHASVIDGAMMAVAQGAKLMRFRHNDAAHLSVVLSKIPDDAGKLVVIDGVYSMSGELAPLNEIVPVCKANGAFLVVDDAHGSGVLGNQGRGTVDHFGLNEQVDLITGTFSKSFASLGGYVVGEAKVIDFIRHQARSLIFSASMTPVSVAAATAALDIMLTEPDRQQRVNENTTFMRNGLRELGFDIGSSTTPIIPIFIRDEYLTVHAQKRLLELGVYTNPVVPPAVTIKDCMLRTSYMATHTIEELTRALKVFEQVGKEIGVI